MTNLLIRKPIRETSSTQSCIMPGDISVGGGLVLLNVMLRKQWVIALRIEINDLQPYTDPTMCPLTSGSDPLVKNHLMPLSLQRLMAYVRICLHMPFLNVPVCKMILIYSDMAMGRSICRRRDTAPRVAVSFIRHHSVRFEGGMLRADTHTHMQVEHHSCWLLDDKVRSACCTSVSL